MAEYIPVGGKVTKGEDGKEVVSLIPTIHVGDGTSEDGEKFEILTTWNQAPVIQFEDGSRVVWNWKDIINQAFEIKKENE